MNPIIVNQIDETIGRIFRTKKENQEKSDEFVRVATFINAEERRRFNSQETTEYEWTSEEEIDWAYNQLLSIGEMFRNLYK